MAEDARARIASLMDAAWTASAVARVLERGADATLAEDDPAVPLLLKAGLLARTPTGYALAGADAFRGTEHAVVASIRSCLGQSAAIAHGSAGWGRNDDEVLMAQGVASSAGGPGFAAMITHLGLEDRFREGGVLLDVGVGVAALACSFCEAVPRARVIGLDVLPRALELARELVAARGLEERVELRRQGVEELADEAVADLAHMSPVFIPPAVVPEGLRRIRRALRPGGWLALSGIVVDGPDSAALRWMVHHAGGSALGDADVARLATDLGYAAPVPAPLPPGAPRVLLLQRPVDG
jgi:SAM-dependent methyltransferase